LAQWESLEVYLKEPEIEIDNNLVENAIRPTALGKKNWLFFGDADAGQRSAIIYSIIESCRRHNVEPYTYLRDVLTRLPTMTNRQIKDIVPKAWAAATRNTALGRSPGQDEATDEESDMNYAVFDTRKQVADNTPLLPLHPWVAAEDEELRANIIALLKDADLEPTASLIALYVATAQRVRDSNRRTGLERRVAPRGDSGR
jgi:hypothetical protein